MDITEMNEGPHHSHRVIMRRIAKQSIGSITPHTISQKFLTQYSLKHFFLTKSSFLLGISKIPYQNQAE